MKNKFLIGLSALMLSLSCLPLAAHATELPTGVLTYLRQKDPGVKVRFDGLVIFSNGETYVPVIPQDPALNPEPQQVIVSLPEKVAYPDLVEFDNHFFLLRLIQTASGRLTFPKMTEYPLQMKEGLLPQDFVLPSNLFIPVELKVILGALPYNPSFDTPKTPVLTPPAVTLNPLTPTDLPPLVKPMTPRTTYVFDLNEQKVLAIDSLNGSRTGDVALDCVPSRLQLSTDGKLLFAPCLSSDELAVVDTGSNLVKTRIPVGQRPDAVLYLDKLQEVLVSNRYSPFLSLVDANTLLSGEKITLPGNGGAMTAVPNDPEGRIVLADTTKPQLYVLNVSTRSVERTLKSLPNISALWVGPDAQGHLEIWAVSRSKNQVQVLDLASGNEIKTLNVGEKPVDLGAFGNRLYVVAAGSDQIDIIDRKDKTLLTPIPLSEGSFPSGMMTLPSEKRAYVTTAGTTNLVVVNLEFGRVEDTMPVEFRAGMIAMTPDATEEKSTVSAGNKETQPESASSTDSPKTPPEQSKTVNHPGKGKNPDPIPAQDKGKKSRTMLGFTRSRSNAKNTGPEKQNAPQTQPFSTPERQEPQEAQGPQPRPSLPSERSNYPLIPAGNNNGGPMPIQNGGKLTFKLGKHDKPRKELEQTPTTQSIESSESQTPKASPAETSAPNAEPSGNGESPAMMEEISK